MSVMGPLPDVSRERVTEPALGWTMIVAPLENTEYAKSLARVSRTRREDWVDSSCWVVTLDACSVWLAICTSKANISASTAVATSSSTMVKPQRLLRFIG